jgi:hypothetical protein
MSSQKYDRFSRTLGMANKIARQHHGPQECDYNLQDWLHKFSVGLYDKMAHWQSKMNVVQTTQITMVFIPSVQKSHDLYFSNFFYQIRFTQQDLFCIS